MRIACQICAVLLSVTVGAYGQGNSGLSYGQEAHRRVGTMIALGILFAPLALFGLFHKTRLQLFESSFTAAHRVPIAVGFRPNFPCYTRLRRCEFCARPPASQLPLSYRLAGFAPEPRRRCQRRSRNVPPRAGTLSRRPERKSGSLGTLRGH